MTMLKAVNRDDLALDESFADEVRKEFAGNPSPVKPTVKTIIASTSRTLTKYVGEMRKLEALEEAKKAAATKTHDSIVAAAKLDRDNVHAEADAALHQLRSTIEVLDPARAKLAEQAAE